MLIEDVERELANWALWRSSGGWHGLRPSSGVASIYAAGLPRYRESFVPVLSGAAWDVDNIVTALAGELRLVLHVEYLRALPDGRRLPRSYTQRQLARAANMPPRSYERKLADARRLVGDHLAELRRRTEARHAARGS